MKDNIYLLDGIDSFTRIYYGDGHIEYIEENIIDYVKGLKVGSGYKRPIKINNHLLYPTSHSKDYECLYINISCLDHYDQSFKTLLNDYHIYDKAIALYIKKKEKYFLEDIG